MFNEEKMHNILDQKLMTSFFCSNYTSYNDRINKFGFESLEYRRWEFDLLTLYKIINGKYKSFFNQLLVFPKISIN